MADGTAWAWLIGLRVFRCTGFRPNQSRTCRHCDDTELARTNNVHNTGLCIIDLNMDDIVDDVTL